MGKKVQGIRSINGRYKIDRGRVRKVGEMEKPNGEAIYIQLINMIHGHKLSVGGHAGGRVVQGRGE